MAAHDVRPGFASSTCSRVPNTLTTHTFSRGRRHEKESASDLTR
jgi:hypothetical protein